MILKRLIEKETLSAPTAYELIHDIADGRYSDEQLAGIMVALQTRNLLPDEVAGFQKALLELALKPQIDGSNAIDLCGTGGDGKDTFNISTATSFVLASMGYKVIKHGNYGVSSICGSSNVLEALGIQFTTNNRDLNEQLEKHNLVFLHAPLFHPVMKKVAPIRKSLGVPTFFNIMGPLVNPVQPAYQLSGTFNLSVARIYHTVLQPLRKNYSVIYGLDGYDEISLTGETRVFSAANDELFTPELLGLDRIHSNELAGGKTIQEAARIVKAILQGQGSEAQTRVVAASTAHAIRVFDPSINLHDAYHDAYQTIRKGIPYKQLQKLASNLTLNLEH
jgi:anthranilate phosphoribosyltransferase